MTRVASAVVLVALVGGVLWFAPWWANPTYFIAVTASLLNRPRIAILFAIVAALLAVSYELIGFYEQGVSATLNELLPGCFMWIASLQLLACHELWRQWFDWQRRIYTAHGRS